MWSSMTRSASVNFFWLEHDSLSDTVGYTLSHLRWPRLLTASNGFIESSSSGRSAEDPDIALPSSIFLNKYKK